MGVKDLLHKKSLSGDELGKVILLSDIEYYYSKTALFTRT